jgi:hypothetical protein
MDNCTLLRQGGLDMEGEYHLFPLGEIAWS